MGRRADPHVPEAFTIDALRAWSDRSAGGRDHRSRAARERAAVGQVRREHALDPLGDDVLDGLRDIYDEEIREHVHTRW